MTSDNEPSRDGVSSSGPPAAVSRWTCLLFFAWMGTVVGVAESLRASLLQLWWGSSLLTSEHAFWMRPLAETVVFLALGSLFTAALCWLPGRSLLYASTGALVMLGVCSVCWGILQTWAVMVFGLGLALWFARWAQAHAADLPRLMALTAPGLVLITLVGGLWNASRSSDASASASWPHRSPAGPNVLLVVLDTVRADMVELNHDTKLTPNLARLAEQSVVFRSAIAPAPWTLPTHASLFTGLYPDDHSANWHAPLDRAQPTLAEVFRQQGYATAGFVGNLYYCSSATGLARGFDHYEDHEFRWNEVLRHSYLVAQLSQFPQGLSWLGVYDDLGRKPGDRVTEGFYRWLDGRTQRPFFAFLNYFDAHDPYLPDELLEGKRSLTHQEKLRLRRWRHRDVRKMPPEDLELARACYRSVVHELDQQMGSLMAELKRRGLYENTLIVVTSDHGEQFGEHGLCTHGNSVYRPLVHVPLIMRLPGPAPIHTQVDEPVSLCDLPRTMLQISEPPSAHQIPGVSLVPLWTENVAGERPRAALTTVDPHPRLDHFPQMCHSPAANGKQYGLLLDGTYYAEQGNGTVQLYDFARDPGEQVNLAEDHALRSRREKLQQALAALVDPPAGSRVLQRDWRTRYTSRSPPTETPESEKPDETAQPIHAP